MSVKVYRGDTWQRAWLLEDGSGAPIDLTGASARLHVRDDAGTLLVSASTADGRLTLTPAQGRIDMLVPASAMAIAPGAYRFDIEVTFASGVRRTYEQDTLVVLEDISRD